MKKAIAMFLVVTILLSVGISASATTTEELREQEVMLSHEIENVVQMDVEALDEDLTEDFDQRIMLSDMKGTEYAYFVPLMDGTTIEGYSVISIVGVTNTLVTAIGENAATFTSYIINEAASADKMIYEFPNAFISKKGDTYNKICIDGTLDPISNPEQYESTTVEYLEGRTDQVTTRATINYGQLDNWDEGDFVPVIAADGNRVCYGGWQSWLQDEGVSKFYANRSCGVTAAANMMHYLSENVSGMDDLYTRTGIRQSQFSAFQKDVYDYLSPAVWGIPDIQTMARRVESFAEDQGVELNAVIKDIEWTESTARNYIVAGLREECPVLLLTWNSPSEEDLDMHWVTVTRVYDSGSGTKMVTSNWSEKEIYDFSAWVNSTSLYKGLLYFK